MNDDSNSREKDPAPSDDAAATFINALPNGTRLFEFEIIRPLGEGGFKVVYLAFDHSLHREVAIAEYLPSAYAVRRTDQTIAARSSQHQATYEAGLRSFVKEARLLAQFEHPAFIKVLRFWEGNGTAYMAMSFYPGRTLAEILRTDRTFATQPRLEALIGPLLDAVSLLHSQQCFHRDISPDNIIVQPNGAPVLLDFGAARRIIGGMTQALTVVLKPGYAPIEQYVEDGGLIQGPWTDVYGFAALLYAAVTGKPPAAAVTRAYKDTLTPLAQSPPDGFDPVFLQGIDAGLAVKPEDRPQSIEEFRALLGLSSVDDAQQTVIIPRMSNAAGPSAPVTLGARGEEPMGELQATSRAPHRTIGKGPSSVAPLAPSSPGTVGSPSPEPGTDDSIRAGVPRGWTGRRAWPIVLAAGTAVVMAIAWVLGAFSISPQKEEARAPAELKVTRESVADRADHAPVEAAAAPGVDHLPERPAPPAVAATPPSPAPAAPAPRTDPAAASDKEGTTIAATPGVTTSPREMASSEPATTKAPKEKAGASQRVGPAPASPRSTSDEPARTTAPAPRDRAPTIATPDAATKSAAVDSDRTAEIASAPKDLSDEARRLYASAQGGNSASQNALATMYFNGRGAPQSDAEAARWYAKAAEQGHASAQNALGFMYFSGRGVAKDQPEGARWWLKAAAQGHATAQNNIGGAYRYGYGVEKNEPEAVKWYRRSAEQGHAGSQKALGDMYFYGLGVQQQDAEAIAWYRKAAENGNQKAADELKAIEQLRAK